MSAPAYTTIPATIDIQIDEDQQRILVTISGPVSGRRVGPVIGGMFLDRPELSAFDMLYDLLDYTGDVEAEHLKPIMEAYAACEPDPSVSCRTAFATLDPNFSFWAEAMNFQFPGREHRAFRTIAEAESFLVSAR